MARRRGERFRRLRRSPTRDPHSLGGADEGLWYCSGEQYLGTLVIRLELTAELIEVGGHIGRRIILANGGVYEDQRLGEDRFWVDLNRR